MKRFDPMPGRVVVAMNPIRRGTGIKNALGEEIMKTEQTIAQEKYTQKIGEVVAIGDPVQHDWGIEEPKFSVGDEVLITRAGAIELDLSGEGSQQTYLVLGFMNIVGVFREVDGPAMTLVEGPIPEEPGLA